MREVSKDLMAYEASINKGDVEEVFPAFAVAEKLRPHLANLLGIGGFRALLSRALILAKEEVSWLSEVKVTEAGRLEGLGMAQLHLDTSDFSEGSVILVAQLIGLLAAFIGLNLTLRQIEEVWPGFSVSPSVTAGDEVQSEEAN